MLVSEIRTKAREAAKLVLDTYWADGLIPVEPITIARSMGLSVLSAQLGNDIFGMLVGSDGSADIYLDVDQPVNRMRFTCAHELGHFIDRSDELNKGEAFVDRRSDDGRGDAAEIFANEFAGSLLMPAAAVARRVAVGSADLLAARDFGVSLAAYRYRKQLLSIA